MIAGTARKATDKGLIRVKKALEKGENPLSAAKWIWCIHAAKHWTSTVRRRYDDMETQPAAINSKILGWAWQQDACSEGEVKKGLSSSLERGHEGCISEVLQEDSCSSVYSTGNYCVTYSYVISCALVICLQFLTCREAVSWYWLVFIFRRLKINHDSHEFILESGIVANTNECCNRALDVVKLSLILALNRFQMCCKKFSQ